MLPHQGGEHLDGDGGPGSHLIVGAYYHYAGGFEAPAAEDISPKPGKTDPMYVVFARKEA